MNRKSSFSGTARTRSAAPMHVNSVLTDAEKLEQAQALVYQAWEAKSDAQAARLAHQALETSCDCVDAYTILAESEASSAEDACLLYQQGVDAGRRHLGETVFAQ